ncbi:hypothetical protein [Lactobacillus crispatus]|uniref:Uncharacterized protein n=1 Tax=Lactobacillus crispatus TaxID=47770 RepID=A0A7H9E7Y9_9LACO|nr:hypothetical protein [Lactobacillus crispatus]QLL73365.1 hypothetical protein GTO85_02745 [Lactobacillus crispatus]
MKEVTSLEDILFNVVKPNKEGNAKGLVNSCYVIDIVQPAQLNKSDNLIVIKKKIIKYGFDAKNLKYDQASNFITYINQDWIKNYGYVINDKIYQKEKTRLENKGIGFYLYSKYLNCNNDRQLYCYFEKMIKQMNKVILESIKQIN